MTGILALVSAPARLLALACVTLAATAVAATPERQVHDIPRCPTPPHIDGVLDEAAWERAWTTELPFEVSPADSAPAAVRTEVLMMHDERFLYVGIRAFDPNPEAIRAHLTDRDAAWDDDWAGVVLDTFNDERRDYLLLVNPLGVQMDTIESWPGEPSEWDAIWASAARITDWGWSAELRIPFSSLRFQRSDRPQVWGFDAIRGYPRDRTRQMGAFARDRNNNCYLCQAIKVRGFEGVSPGRNIELAPAVVATRTQRRPDLGSTYGNAEDDTEPGLTARWGITPNITVATTLNPDFSQVEADARELDVNEPFALFFAEKRPFFMEGADFFSTPINAVYTRVIRDPSWGLKVTGKEGAHTIGAYVVEDEITNLVFPGADRSSATSLDTTSTAAVARYKRDFGNRLTLGLLATGREAGRYSNRVGGLDIDLRLSERDRLQAQLLSSETRYPDTVARDHGQPLGDFSGTAVDLLFTHETRTFSMWAQAEDVDRGFRADLGFVPRVDIRGGEVGGGWDWIGTDDTWYSLINLKTKIERREDQGGLVLFEENVVQLTAYGPLQSQLVVRLADGREGFASAVFGADTEVLKVSLNPNGHSSFTCYLRTGDRIDYANVRQGTRVHLNPSFWYRFGIHLSFVGRHVWERMKVDEGRLYTANVSELTTTWQASTRSFLRAIVQLVDYDFVSTLYADRRDERFRHLFSQLLYSYKLNPRTVLFVGYSDNSYDDPGGTLTRADRTLFVKLGYAWVL